MTILTGRTPSRKPIAYCHGCQSRVMYGDPNPNARWASALVLTPEQGIYILESAAEFVAMGKEWAAIAEERGYPSPPPPTAIQFVDWMLVDALRTGVNEAPFYDGAPARNLAGEVTNAQDAAHRHPDPLPFAPIRRTRP